MPKLPDSNYNPTSFGARPVPGYERPRQAAKVVPHVKDSGFSSLAQGVGDIAKSIAKVESIDSTFAAMGLENELKAWVKVNQYGEDGQGGWNSLKESQIGPTFIQDQGTPYEDKVIELSESLGNDKAREKFLQRAALVGLTRQQALFGHVTLEKEREHKRTYTTQIEQAVDSAGQLWADQAGLAKVIEGAKDAVHNWAAKQGFTPEDLAFELLKVESGLHLKAIGAAVDDHSSSYAAIMLEKAKGKMLKEDIETAEESILNENSVEQAQDIVEGFDPEMSFADRRAWIKKNTSGQIQEHALIMLNADKSAETFIENDGYANAESDAYTIYNNWVDHEDMEKRLTPMEAFYEIPDSVRSRMDPKSLSAMRRMAEIRSQGQSVHTLFEPWQELHELAKNDIDKFRLVNLNHYVDRISTSDLKGFAEMQTDVAKLDIMTSENDIFTKAAGDIYGYDTSNDKYLITKEQSDELRDRFDSEMLSEAKARKRDLTILEKKEIGDRIAKDIIFRKSSYLDITTAIPGGKPYLEFPGTLFGKDEVVAAANAEIEGVPKEQIDEYAKMVGDAKAVAGDDNPVYAEDVLKLSRFFNPVEPVYDPSFFEIDEAQKRRVEERSRSGG